MDYTEKTVSAQDIYRGRIVHLHVDEVSLPDGKTAAREVVEHSGGVAIIPVDDDGGVYCVRQYRYALGCHLLEVPAGKLNEGEDPFECAVRELSEETGFTADNFVSMGFFYPSAGYCHEKIYIYLATGLHRGEAHLDEGEFLDVEKYPLAELVRMAENNELYDGKTALAVLRTERYLKKE